VLAPGLAVCQCYLRSSKLHGLRTASVNPLTYLRRRTWENGTPDPVCESLSACARMKPTRAALRAAFDSFALFARICRKFCAVGLVGIVGLLRFAGGRELVAASSHADLFDSSSFSESKRLGPLVDDLPFERCTSEATAFSLPVLFSTAHLFFGLVLRRLSCATH
jgi:hypothetical protein